MWRGPSSRANEQPALAACGPDPAEDGATAYGVMVLQVSGPRISRITGWPIPSSSTASAPLTATQPSAGNTMIEALVARRDGVDGLCHCPAWRRHGFRQPRTCVRAERVGFRNLRGHEARRQQRCQQPRWAAGGTPRPFTMSGPRCVAGRSGRGSSTRCRRALSPGAASAVSPHRGLPGARAAPAGAAQ